MLEIIGYVAIVWVFTNYLGLALDKLKLNKLQKYVCLKCYTFFFVLFFTLNPFIAATSSLLAYLLDKHILTKDIEL